MAPVNFIFVSFVSSFLIFAVLANDSEDQLQSSGSSNSYHFSSHSTHIAESRQTTTQFRYYDEDPGTPSTFNSYNRGKVPSSSPPGWPAKPWFYRGPGRSKPRPVGYGYGRSHQAPAPPSNSERSSLYKHDSPSLRYADGSPVPSFYSPPSPNYRAYSKPKMPPAIPAPAPYIPSAPAPTAPSHQSFHRQEYSHNVQNKYNNHYVNLNQQQPQKQSFYVAPPPKAALAVPIQIPGAYSYPPTPAPVPVAPSYSPQAPEVSYSPAPAPPHPQIYAQKPSSYSNSAPSPSYQQPTTQFVVHNQEPISAAYTSGDALGSYSSPVAVTQSDHAGGEGKSATAGTELRFADDDDDAEASFPQQYIIPVLSARVRGHRYDLSLSYPSVVAPSYSRGAGGDEYYTHSTYASPYKHVHIEYFKHLITPATKSYDVEFKSGNGIHQQEHGYVKTIPGYTTGSGHSVIAPRLANVKTGSVSWTSPEGIPFSFSYIADENGFRPVGPHISGAGSPQPSYGHFGGSYDSYASTNYETLSLPPPEPDS